MWGGRGCGRLMCAPVVVVEDVGADFEVSDGAGDFEDAVVGPCAHAFHDATHELTLIMIRMARSYLY